MSLILKAIDKNIKNGSGQIFIKQLSPLLSNIKSSMTRMQIVTTLASLTDEQRKSFLKYMPKKISEENLEKIFNKIQYLVPICNSDKEDKEYFRKLSGFSKHNIIKFNLFI